MNKQKAEADPQNTKNKQKVPRGEGVVGEWAKW